MSSQHMAACRRSLMSIVQPGLRLAAALTCAASVAACASDAPPPSSARAPDGAMTAVGVAGTLSGQWAVADVHPSGRVDLTAEDRKALMGRVISVSDTHAEDISGRVCESPSFSSSAMSMGDALGTRQAMAGMTNRATVVHVSCAGAPFGRYVFASNGVVLTSYKGTWVSLQPAASAERASAMVAPAASTAAAPPAPAPAMAPAHAPEAAVGKDAMEGAHAKPKAQGKMGMHLASYRGEGMAREGWAEVKKAFPALSSLSPVYTSVVLGGKGTFVRLYAVGPEVSEMERLCADLRKSKQYCVVMPTEKGH